LPDRRSIAFLFSKRDSCRGGFRAPLALLIAAFALLVAPAMASGATFKVKSTGNGADDNVGDGVCADANGKCTLRAAIEESSSETFSVDLIKFSGSTVRGRTIVVPAASDPLPTIGGPVTIDGCSSVPGHVGPCVGLRTEDTSDDAFRVFFNNVKIKGLAITHASRGVAATFAAPQGLVVKNNWFGRKLNGTPEGNDTGLETTGHSGKIGGDTSVERNVFSDSTTGIRIEGGSNNVVQGNRFGTKADGSGFIPNDENIEITGFGHPINIDATGNVIGGTVSASKAATAKCDGICNLIVNATGNGIDLLGGGGIETPAVDTTVAGNFIGLNRSGTSDRGNGARGVEASSTHGTTIGGESSRDRNFVAGNNGNAILGGDATGLTIKRNYIGFDSSGAAAVPNGVAVQISGGIFERNRVGGNGTAPGNGLVLLDPVSAEVVHNTFGVGTGGQRRGFPSSAIAITGTGTQKQIGGDTEEEANTIGNATSQGIQINGGDGNAVEGNHIGTDPSGTEDHGNGVGVLLTAGANEVEGNTVEANLISNSDTDAIELSGDGSDDNFLAQNTGKNNGDPTSTSCGGGPCDLFIDLVGSDGFGNGVSGPNQGIEAPTITSVENVGEMTVSGTSTAPAGTEVFVYRTKSPAGVSPSRIEAVLSTSAVVDGSGNWTATLIPHQPSDQRITALQIATQGNTSEFAISRPATYP